MTRKKASDEPPLSQNVQGKGLSMKERHVVPLGTRRHCTVSPCEATDHSVPHVVLIHHLKHNNNYNNYGRGHQAPSDVAMNNAFSSLVLSPEPPENYSLPPRHPPTCTQRPPPTKPRDSDGQSTRGRFRNGRNPFKWITMSSRSRGWGGGGSWGFRTEVACSVRCMHQ